MNKQILIAVITLSLITFYSCKNDPIYGCIDPNATNFNPEANIMQDSTCIKIFTQSITRNFNKTYMKFDKKKYSNARYFFIYKPSITWRPGMIIENRKSANDTTYKIKKYTESRNKAYRNATKKVKGDFDENTTYSYNYYEIIEADTLVINLNNDSNNSRRVFIDDNVKVIEEINGLKSKEYFIDILDEGSNLINPASYFKYKTETAQYGGPEWAAPSQNIKYYKGFYINTNDEIDFWFKKLPSSVSVTEFEKKIGTRRTNIIRY